MLDLHVFAGLIREARPAPRRRSRLVISTAVALGAVASASADVPVVELVGIVHAVSAAHVVSAIDRADAAQAPLLVLRLDTPGGLDTSMRQIIDKILNCRTPVAVFVGPSGARAASAGFLIAIAADVVAMAPGTNMGAAHPVSVTGTMDEVMSGKVTSDAAAYLRGKAERRGRNPDLAEKAVVKSRSFTEKEALDGKLIDLVVKDVPELLAALDGRSITRFDGTRVTLALRGEKTFVVAMNWRQAILSLIARPETLFLLLLGALAGLGTEISHPGMLFPGIVGVLCLVLFLFATQVLPVSGTGILLVVLAFALFAAEIKVPAYGLLTTAGIIAMILGAMMLVEGEVPALRPRIAPLIILAMAAAVGTSLLVRMALRAQRLRPTTGEAGMMGQKGTAATALGPEGWVRVQGELWDAVAESTVEAGEPVIVASVEGLRLHVRKGA
jgi:membrane-bound serine protease (ClpP class)